MVLTADCVPIAIAGGGAVAMLHAGWRGLAAGVVAEGVGAVRELGASGPLSAAIGPGAGPCCYEVGEDVHAAFAEYGADARRGFNLDMKAVARIQLRARRCCQRGRRRAVHDLLGSEPVLLAPQGSRDHRAPGGDRVVDLIRGLRPERVRANLERVREEIASTGRAVDEVEILAAVKYVPVEELGALADGGVKLVGENRAQDLIAKADAYPGRFTWDFIGHLQSRKVRQILPHVRYIHSVASDSVLTQLERHAPAETEILIEVNVSGEPGKSGIEPPQLGAFIERCSVTVVGLMTMPPLASAPDDSRPYFAALRELAERHKLVQLSMGTSQDYLVAVQEGATIVRLGTGLFT